jgi:thiol-disulfide isomerase/thioredoxin
MNSLGALMLTVTALHGAPQGELLDFSAKWCGPCQSVAPIVERLHRKGYPIRKIDVDKHPELASKYGVNSIPQFILVVNGKPRRRLIGPQSEKTLINLMAQIPKASPEPKETDRREVKGEQAVARDDRPSWRRGIPIPFLGKSEDIEAEDIEEVRGQNDERPFEKPLEKTTTSVAEERGPLTNDPMSASVRLRVNRKGNINYGTGTVIESRPSRTLVITCGHIFRGTDAQTPIDVDYFDGQEKTTWKGKLLRYDEKADVGLIAVRTDRVLPSIHIAEDPDQIRKRDLVSSIGCGNGKPPTRWQMFVKSVDQFVGSSIIECTHAPLSGRSGGGLFNRRGELIGICMAADRDRDSGLYAGLKEIHKLLDAVSLTALYKQQESEKTLLAEDDELPTVLPSAAEVSDQPKTSQASENSKSVSEAAPLPKITPAKVHKLSNAEIDAVAAALQMSGTHGVKITIESLEDSSEGYQILITNRAEPVSQAALANSRPTASLSDQLARHEIPSAADVLEWDNLLERRETNKVPHSELSRMELPVWAR